MIENTEGIVNIIGQLGFPIFVAAYLLFRMEKVLKTVEQQVKESKEYNKKIFDYFIRNERG